MSYSFPSLLASPSGDWCWGQAKDNPSFKLFSKYQALEAVWEGPGGGQAQRWSFTQLPAKTSKQANQVVFEVVVRVQNQHPSEMPGIQGHLTVLSYFRTTSEQIKNINLATLNGRIFLFFKSEFLFILHFRKQRLIRKTLDGFAFS